MRVSLDEVLKRIEKSDVIFDVRWESFCYDNAERVLRLAASTSYNVSGLPEDFEPGVWIYARFGFIRTLYSGEQLASFMRELIIEGRSLDIGIKYDLTWNGLKGTEAEFEAMRIYSSQWSGFQQRELPFVLYELPLDVDNDPLFNPHQPMNGDGMPYFPSLQAAETYFLLDAFLDNATPARRALQVIIEDKRAYFRKVFVTQKGLSVTIDGEILGEAELKLYGKRPGLIDVIKVGGRTEIEIPLDTLPTELNLYLSVGNEILDHRVVSERASIYAPTAGVTFESNETIGIEGILDLRGENQYTEFKRSFSEGVLKAACAFANADGGSVFIGVTDEGEIIGIRNWDQVRLQIENALYDRLVGHVGVQYQAHPAPGLDDTSVVLEVRVLEAEVKPVALREPEKGERLYIRRDGTNRVMKRDDIIRLINQQQPTYNSLNSPLK